MLVIKQLDDLKKLSAYYSPLDANKKYYYNLYVEAGGKKPFEEYETEDVLELIANADSAGSTYHFDLNEDNTIRWYSAKSGGGYQIDQAHGQFLRLFSDAGTSVYIHYAQVYQPVDYVRENIDIMSLVLAVTYSNAAYNLACMEDYIRDAEIISAKLQELNRDYQKLTMLRSGSPTQASTDYCVIQSSIIKELLEANFLTEVDRFITGVEIRPLQLRCPVVKAPPKNVVNWYTFTINRSWDKDIDDSYFLNNEHAGIYYSDDKEGEQSPTSPQIQYGDINDIIYILSNSDNPVRFHMQEPHESGYAWYENELSIYDSKYEDGKYVKGDQIYPDITKLEGWTAGAAYVTIPNFDTLTYKKESTVKEIIDEESEIEYAFISGRDLDSYLDIIREQIDTLNNQLQIPTTYISLESNDLSTCFDTATNILSNVGTQLQTITRNTRI